MAIDPKRVKEIFLEAAGLVGRGRPRGLPDKAAGPMPGCGNGSRRLRSHDPRAVSSALPRPWCPTRITPPP